MLGRSDVERIVENVLANLTINVKDGNKPSDKIIELLYNNRVLSETTLKLGEYERDET